MFSKINFRVLYTFFSAIFIIIGTLIAIQYAKGNIRLTDKGVVQDTGLLAANSFPTGAQVFINGELATATDDTLYLEPGSYNIEIKKDGFSPWRKTMQLRKELVTQTNAQ
ncbi:MAG: PEGA domain-containing protein, partial [Patescibacteria group bacterium]